MAFLQLLLAVVCLAAAGWAWRGRFGSSEATRRCPHCQAELEALGPGPAPDRTYEINACPACDFAETTVHGVRSPLAYCPACHQRALHLTVRRVGDRVEVTGACHLCGHRDTHGGEVDRLPPVGGKVIPFRRPEE